MKDEDKGLPEHSLYEKPGAIKKIKDKTGWKLMPENEMIMKGGHDYKTKDGEKESKKDE